MAGEESRKTLPLHHPPLHEAGDQASNPNTARGGTFPPPEARARLPVPLVATSLTTWLRLVTWRNTAVVVPLPAVVRRRFVVAVVVGFIPRGPRAVRSGGGRAPRGVERMRRVDSIRLRTTGGASARLLTTTNDGKGSARPCPSPLARRPTAVPEPFLSAVHKARPGAGLGGAFTIGGASFHNVGRGASVKSVVAREVGSSEERPASLRKCGGGACLLPGDGPLKVPNASFERERRFLLGKDDTGACQTGTGQKIAAGEGTRIVCAS
jgi:hypothetical protein